MISQTSSATTYSNVCSITNIEQAISRDEAITWSSRESKSVITVITFTDVKLLGMIVLSGLPRITSQGLCICE